MLDKRFRLAFTVAVLFSSLILSKGLLYGEDCVGCHENPQYKKEDIQTLKKCLACHGSEGHPYKEIEDPGFGPAAALAAESDLPNSFSHQARLPNLSSMVFIPEGEFIMGSDDRLKDERPAHVVYIDAFYIDRFEVTNSDYKKFVDATGHAPPVHWEGGSVPEDKFDHPVVYVSWNDANKYCAWEGKRLPREAEWEKAARGIDGRMYPWGNIWDVEKTNNPLRGEGDTLPIGSFEEGKSPYELYDMSGNVWEWVDEHYFGHAGSDYVNPEFGTKHRLLKGGSWWDCMFYGCGISAPTYNRAFFHGSTKNDSIGLRCVADVNEEEMSR